MVFPRFFSYLVCLLVGFAVASAFTADRIDCSSDGECSALSECIVLDANVKGHNCTLHCLVRSALACSFRHLKCTLAREGGILLSKRFVCDVVFRELSYHMHGGEKRTSCEHWARVEQGVTKKRRTADGGGIYPLCLACVTATH